MRTLTELLRHDAIVGDPAEFLAQAAEAELQLRPEGFLEIHFAAEIFRDTWRLNLMATVDESGFGEDAREARRHYRDRLNASLRRNTKELRQLQTDRHLNNRWKLDLPATASARDVLRFEKTNPNRQPSDPPQSEIRKNEPKPATVQDAERLLHAQIEEAERAEFAEIAARPNQIARNAPCPCKSGEKYKRCCGKDAPPLLNLAA